MNADKILLQVYSTTEVKKALQHLAVDADATLSDVVGFALWEFTQKYKAEDGEKLGKGIGKWKERG